jgi:hypothetical protein
VENASRNPCGAKYAVRDADPWMEPSLGTNDAPVAQRRHSLAQNLSAGKDDMESTESRQGRHRLWKAGT